VLNTPFYFYLILGYIGNIFLFLCRNYYFWCIEPANESRWTGYALRNTSPRPPSTVCPG